MGKDSVQDFFAKLGGMCDSVVRCQPENLRREMLLRHVQVRTEEVGYLRFSLHDTLTQLD